MKTSFPMVRLTPMLFLREATNATSTVMVRQMSDNKWYVIGAASSEIKVTAPVAGVTVTTPVHVAGTSRAFEAN